MHPLDTVLQSTCPCVMCPRYGLLTLLQDNTHRFLIAADGLYVEVRRPWIHAVLKVVDCPIPLPYGPAPQLFNIALSSAALLDKLHHFIERSRAVVPMEHAAWLTFNPVEHTLAYIEPEAISRGAGHIRYQRPDATARCLPVVDCHSHGVLPAFFSREDDGDDLTDDAKIALVVGNLDRPDVSIAMRFTGFGLAVDISAWIRALLYADSIS